MGYNLQELFELITRWGVEKGIIQPAENVQEIDKVLVLTQLAKLIEELGEFAGAVLKDKDDVRRDSIGDTFVVWVMLVNALGYNAGEEVKKAYDIINQRKGKMVGNAFVKEEDL